MYGLPQVGIIAQELLKKRLATHGYHQSIIIPGLGMHTTRPTTFTLVVDAFAIKIMSKNNVDHQCTEEKLYHNNGEGSNKIHLPYH